MRQGDTLVVWKLDRLARSLKQLIETVKEVSGCEQDGAESHPNQDLILNNQNYH